MTDFDIDAAVFNVNALSDQACRDITCRDVSARNVVSVSDSQDLSNAFYVSVDPDTDERQLLFRQVVSGADGSYATEGGRVKYDVYDELGTPLTVMELSKSGLKLSGDLQVTGDTTTLSASSITISDKNILLAEGVTSRSLLDGAGISLGEEDAERSITYAYSTDSLHFNSPISILHEGSSATYGSRELSVSNPGSSVSLSLDDSGLQMTSLVAGNTYSVSSSGLRHDSTGSLLWYEEDTARFTLNREVLGSAFQAGSSRLTSAGVVLGDTSLLQAGLSVGGNCTVTNDGFNVLGDSGALMNADGFKCHSPTEAMTYASTGLTAEDLSSLTYASGNWTTGTSSFTSGQFLVQGTQASLGASGLWVSSGVGINSAGHLFGDDVSITGARVSVGNLVITEDNLAYAGSSLQLSADGWTLSAGLEAASVAVGGTLVLPDRVSTGDLVATGSLSVGGSRLTSGQLEVGSAVLTGDQLSLGDLLLKQQEIVLGEVSIGEHGVEVLGTSLGNASVSVGAYALSSDGLTTGDPDVHLSTSGLHVGATVSLAGSGLQVGSYEVTGSGVLTGSSQAYLNAAEMRMGEVLVSQASGLALPDCSFSANPGEAHSTLSIGPQSTLVVSGELRVEGTAAYSGSSTYGPDVSVGTQGITSGDFHVDELGAADWGGAVTISSGNGLAAGNTSLDASGVSTDSLTCGTLASGNVAISNVLTVGDVSLDHAGVEAPKVVADEVVAGTTKLTPSGLYLCEEEASIFLGDEKQWRIVHDAAENAISFEKNTGTAEAPAWHVRMQID